jgi:putative peptidoglycan lipid II flippase
LVKILAPGFYAKQDIRTPVKIGIGVRVVTQLMNIVFVPWIAHAGLALSIGLGATLNAFFLYVGLRRKGIYLPRAGWATFIVRVTGALFLLAGIGLWMAARFDWMALQSEPVMRIGALLLVMTVCAGSYFGALALMGFRLADFKRELN